MSNQPTYVESFKFAPLQNIKAELEAWAHEHEARILSVSVDRATHFANSILVVFIVWEPLSDGSANADPDTVMLSNVIERLQAAIERLQAENAQLKRDAQSRQDEA